jgi:thymidylate synthase
MGCAQYLDLMQKILDEGVEQMDRTGTGTLSLFGGRCASTSRMGSAADDKKAPFAINYCRIAVVSAGRHNIRWLQERNVSIWNEWADEQGDLGRSMEAMARWETADGVTSTRSKV